MKRYRPLDIEFDTRAMILEMVPNTWAADVRDLTLINIKQVEDELKYEFGEMNFEMKRKNFKDLGVKPFSVVAYHNKFLTQIRNSYIMGEYYPSLTASCALTERIINHMVINLRIYFKNTNQPKRIFSGKNFTDWDLPIKALSDWDILLPTVANDLLLMKELRHETLHFNPVTEEDTQELALGAAKILQTIISNQFGVHTGQPWFFNGSDADYIKKDYEDHPFVKECIIPSCKYLSPYYRVLRIFPWVIEDPEVQIDGVDTDEEFTRLRSEANSRQVK